MQHLRGMLEEAFAGTDVTPTQYAIYSQLGEHELTPRGLGATLGLAPATVSNCLNVMARRGHVIRTPSATDRRSHKVVLTPTGITKWHECRKRMQTAVRELDAQIGSAAARDGLRTALGRLDAAVLAVQPTLAAQRSG